MAGMSVRRVSALAAISVALIACAVFAAGRINRTSIIHADQQEQAGQSMLTAMLDQESGARGYFVTRRPQFLEPWSEGTSQFAQALATSRQIDAGDRSLTQSLADQAQAAQQWRATVLGEIDRVTASGRLPSLSQSLTALAQMETFRSDNAVYASELTERRDDALTDASWVAAGLVAALSVALLMIAAITVRRSVSRERSRYRSVEELRELLQVSASVHESDLLLIRHVERILPGSGAAILARGDDDERLEPTMSETAGQTPLRAIAGVQVGPRSCLAMRLSRSYARRAGEQPLAACDVCGRVKGEVACEPLLVGGTVIGSMLVAREGRFSDRSRAALHDASVQAAPILANQRNLALAEQRAVSDALTGLPNRRAADETFRRLAAQAGRTLSPLAIILLDLDRFKQLNDQHGHDRGDKALATVGQIIATTLRASDFAARFGGEEFLLLLPDTDRRGAVEVAEKLRLAIERVELPVAGMLTGSLGVACLPEDATEPEHLLRKADRALYAAKARGRNRVEVAENGAAGFGGADGGGSRDGGERRDG